MIRKQKHKTVRDNVIFELGLFMGRLGRGRTFVLVPNGVDLHIPSDLVGWNTVQYDSTRKNTVAAVGSACNQIRSVIKDQGHFSAESPTTEVFSAARTLERTPPFASVATKGIRKTPVVALGSTSTSRGNKK